MFSCKKLFYCLIVVLMISLMSLGLFLNYSPLRSAYADSTDEWIDITNKSYTVQDSVMHDVKVVSEGKSYSTVTSLAEGESKTQAYKVNGSGTVEDGRYKSNNLMDLGLTPGATYFNNGITITVNPDLSINAKGTAAEELTFNFCNQEKNPLIWGKPSNFKINLGQEVTLYDNSNNSGYLFQFVFYDINNKIYWLPKGTFNFKFESNLFLGRILIRKGVTIDFDFKPQIIFGKESSYSPYANEEYTYSSTTIPALKGGKIYGNVLEGNAKVYIKSKGVKYFYDFNIGTFYIPTKTIERNYNKFLSANGFKIDDSTGVVSKDYKFDLLVEGNVIYSIIGTINIGEVRAGYYNYPLELSEALIVTKDGKSYIQMRCEDDYFDDFVPSIDNNNFGARLKFSLSSYYESIDIRVTDISNNLTCEESILTPVKGAFWITDNQIVEFNEEHTILKDVITESIFSYKDYSEEELYDKGHNDGYNNGYDVGKEDGYSNGKTEGYNNGYKVGHSAGYIDGESNSAGIDSGLGSFGYVLTKTFNSMFSMLDKFGNINILGVSVWSLIGIVVCIGAVIIIKRFIK